MGRVIGLRLLIACVTSVSVAQAHAEKADAGRARELVNAGEIQSLDSLRAQHGNRLQGRLLSTELEHQHKQWVYELKILGDDGVVREISLNAKNGEWLNEEIEP